MTDTIDRKMSTNTGFCIKQAYMIDDDWDSIKFDAESKPVSKEEQK